METFDGTVLAVTHDRWFAARSFDHVLIFDANGRLRENPEPSWEEGRVARPVGQ